MPIRSMLAAASGLALITLAACSASKQAEPQAQVPAEATVPARTPTVIDSQLRALDKAKSVQGTLDAQNKAANKAIEDAGG